MTRRGFGTRASTATISARPVQAWPHARDTHGFRWLRELAPVRPKHARSSRIVAAKVSEAASGLRHVLWPPHRRLSLRLDQPRRHARRPDEDPRPRDGVLEPQGVQRRDLQQTLDRDDQSAVLDVTRNRTARIIRTARDAEAPSGHCA